ncbi:glycoside hydrolase family 43 protein [Viridothelium virens]|uniref:Glycoside hydrolase family 43 protein n=1 Tax=Viridothelium virens TaxID=1048519 RepID=A0A6A6HCQ7_VIRVR|nr:glycoside hydrolase family 43 protein [Viridothelium virens]
MEYNNAVLTLAPHGTPDPFVVYHDHDGKFYMTYTTGDHIQIWESDDLPGFLTCRKKIIVWRPPRNTDHSAGIWAPELHSISGRWYILYCAEQPGVGNKSHRMFLLGGPPSNQSPSLDHAQHPGAWTDLGHIRGMLTEQWAIDGTFFALHGALYMVYAGSEFGADLDRFRESRLFIVRMRDGDPTTVASTPPVEISRPAHAWEWEGETGVNEGPQWLESPDGAWKGIVYSAGGSWCQNYKMVVLQYLGGEPLDARSWRKGDRPFCRSARSVRGPFGPGHGNFVNLGPETFAVFHATDGPNDGWENRKARCQRVMWTREGPTMDGHVGICVDGVEAFHAGPSSVKKKSTTKEILGDLKAGYKKYTSGW